MSTLTQAQPGTEVPARLLSVPLAVTFLAEFTSLTSFFLLGFALTGVLILAAVPLALREQKAVASGV